MLLPNVIVVGAPKCGTSTFFEWLTDHPDVQGSISKEARYFVDPDSHAFDPAHNYATGGIEGYSHFFAAVPRKLSPRVVVEATPIYYLQKSALAHIPALPSRPKVIFLLREPSEQIWSTYTYFGNNWLDTPHDISFERFVELAEQHSAELGANELLRNALANCRYVDYIDGWLAACGRDRVLIYLFDDLIRDGATFMRGACRDLGLNPAFYDSYAFPRQNETYAVKNVALQRLNIRIRDRLPKGAFYNLLRSAYRSINTAPASKYGANGRTLQIMAELRNRYARSNRLLAEHCGVDVSGWNPPAQP